MAVLDRVDPEYLPVIRAVPNMDLSDIPVARKVLHALYAMGSVLEPHPNVAHEDRLIHSLAGKPDINNRLYRPVEAVGPLPALIWIQCGGCVLTATDPDDCRCQDMVAAGECLVVSVVWRRAPEHPFPAEIDDCYGALRWVTDHVDELSVDRDRIAVGGASSGGVAAASVTLHASDDGASLAHQLLVYPMLDDRNTTQSSHDLTEVELWNRTSKSLAWQIYLGEDYGTDNVSPNAAPSGATELGLLRDENLEYAIRLLRAGVPTEFHMYPAVQHGFDRHNPQGVQAKHMFADRDAVLARAFHRVACSG